MSGNIQRREIHPMDTSSGAETHPVPPALHMIRPGTSRVLPVHLSKHHSLVVAFMKQSDTPPAPFNAVSNISLDDFCTFCFKALRIRLANLLGLDRIIFDSYKLMVRVVISDDQRKALIHTGQRNSRLPHALAPIQSCHLDQQSRYDFAMEVYWGEE